MNPLAIPSRSESSHPNTLVILSGGQTGVDRAALDAALHLGQPCGGWCPAGRRAEDGPITAHYPLRELPGAGYLQRTRKNVEDSEGTLIVTFGPPTGGTARTLEFCRTLKKPYFVLDASKRSVLDAARQVFQFLETQNVRRLNVAGPRASGQPDGYAYTRELVIRLLHNR